MERCAWLCASSKSLQLLCNVHEEACDGRPSGGQEREGTFFSFLLTRLYPDQLGISVRAQELCESRGGRPVPWT